MKPLIIIQLPEAITYKEADTYSDHLIAAHPSYEFLFIAHGATLSIAHEGNITVTHVLQAPVPSQGT